jgi:hypothetical protein
MELNGLFHVWAVLVGTVYPHKCVYSLYSYTVNIQTNEDLNDRLILFVS